MRYLELTVAVRPEAVEAAAEILRRHAPGGVSIEPPFEAVDEEGAASLDPDAPVCLRGWLPIPDERRPRLTALRRQLRSLGEGLTRAPRTRTVDDASWARAWKRHFPVLRVGRRLVLRPSWRRYRPRPDDLVIDLDPGMAFGTGQHETTRMCLEALEDRIQPGATALDLGTGSGVLALAAARLGAARVDAVDVDPLAVRAARENATRNGVERTVRIDEGSLVDAWPFPQPPAGRYDLVLANLSSRLVRELAPPLIEALRPDGVALVSGMVEEQEAACRAALEAAGGHIADARADGAWRLFVVTRR